MAGDFSGCTARKKNRAQSIEYNPAKVDTAAGETSKQQTNPLTTRSGLRVYKIVILGDGGVGKSGRSERPLCAIRRSRWVGGFFGLLWVVLGVRWNGVNDVRYD